MKRQGVRERIVVSFAHACVVIGLLLALSLGLLMAFLANGGDAVFELLGPRTTAWWASAVLAWVVFVGAPAALVLRRQEARARSARASSDSGDESVGMADV